MPQKILEWFSKLTKFDVDFAGGKGASLGEMTQAKIPVPNGFVISSHSFEKFINETKISDKINQVLNNVNPNEMSSIDLASEKIKKMILAEKMPLEIEQEIMTSFKKLGAKFVAVRSSATSEDSSSAAWAGQLDSFLNTTEKQLMINVKNCWASLFTPRAIFYRFEKGLHETKISVAVVVQKMVDSEISGIAFSVHPVTQDRNQLIIEAGLGLGEAIVSGQITPDAYVVSKQPFNIIEKNVNVQEKGLFRVESGGNEWKKTIVEGKKQVLSDKQILELSKIILRIEKHYSFPCDIEWAFEKNKFFIVQSRPITTLEHVIGDKEMPVNEKIKNTVKKSSEKKVIGEQYDVNKEPFLWTKNFLETNSFDIKGARINVPCLDLMFMAYSKPNIFGNSYAPVIIPYFEQQAKQVIQEEVEKVLERNIWENAIKNKNGFKKILGDAKKIQKQIDSISLNKDKLNKLTNKQLLSYYKKLVKLILEWWKYSSIAENKGLIVDEKLVPLLMTNHDVSGELAFEYVSDITTPLIISVFSKERMEFLDLCIILKKNSRVIETKNKQFFSKLKNYSKKYFYARTSFYEIIDLSENNLLKIVQKETNEISLKELLNEYNKLKNSLKQLEKKQNNHKKLLKPTSEEKDYLWYFKTMHVWQDERKVSMMKQFNYLLKLLDEISERKKINIDLIKLMQIDELEKILLGKKIDLKKIGERKKGVFYVYLKNKVLRFNKNEAKQLNKAIPINIDSTGSIKGTIACKGTGKKVVGKIRKVNNPSKDVFEQGEILVTTMTRPEFVPIMKKALAIITDEGGLTSHAAIVSRELNTPCIIGTKTATTILKDNDLVEIDTNKGLIRILKK